MTQPLIRDWDSEFAAIVYAEDTWLRAEFDALIHASFGDGALGGVDTDTAHTPPAAIRPSRPDRVPNRGVARRRPRGPRPRPPPLTSEGREERPTLPTWTTH